ncbi:hypothetical protein [Leekyejoonella antrihumi]|uniref:Uncharacterized protein n=1 Tax=Leekyejoonella antrihumi TaxID=1660198 RepID=A0A563E2P3_9MICO|nr:hypothetical protein [Leekyejoonella antrihumi]TWP36164.1 hypothetical protein FGL98_10705 [Leekyejoonella antrihumi]
MATTESSSAASNLAPLQAALGPGPTVLGATFQWPWDIAKKGGELFSQVSGVASTLASSAQSVVTSPSGATILANVAADPRNSTNTEQVLNSGLFGPAINAVKADSLLRTMFIGWSGGAQVGLFGGGGGSGVASDLINPNAKSPVGYGMFKLGIGAQVTVGLLVGAMAVEPAQLNSSTCVFEFGAGLMGIGTFVQVIMTDRLDLLGFTVNVGAGGGLSSATGYGSISAG